MKQLSNFLIFAFFIGIPTCNYAQNFMWETRIDSVQEKGFYSIPLNPEITSRLKNDFSDLRIFDEKNVEIPYLLRRKSGLDQKTNSFFEIKGVKISQMDSAAVKQTYVKFTFDFPQLMDKLEFRIKGPTYFMRNAQLAIVNHNHERRWNDETYFETIQYLELGSTDSVATFSTQFRAKEFYLIIDNGDNQPLEIESIAVYQIKNTLVSLLEKGKNYLLKFGDEELMAPDYDLGFFEDTIPKSIPTLETGEIIQLQPQKVKEPKSAILSNKAILWTVIGVGVVLLGLLSIKMIRDLSKKNAA